MKRFTIVDWLPWLMILMCMPVLTGCPIVVPVIDSFKQMGMTEGDRKNLLKPVVMGFQRALSSGDLDGALSYLKADDPRLRQSIIDEVRSNKHKEKVVDSNMDLVLYSDEARRAEVEVLVKYFEVPYYVVRQRVEKGDWEFSHKDGWKLVARSVHEVSQ